MPGGMKMKSNNENCIKTEAITALKAIALKDKRNYLS